MIDDPILNEHLIYALNYRHATHSSGYQSALAAIARRIRELVPIAGWMASEHECAARQQLVEWALGRLGVDETAWREHLAPQDREWFQSQVWFTIVCELEPGERVPVFAGNWAKSREEALVEAVLWWPELDGRRIAEWDADPHCIRFTFLKAQAAAAERLQQIDETAVTLW